MKVYTTEGQQIVKKVRKSCESCRYFIKKSIGITEGPISRGMTIAPTFYITQTDIAGPFLASLNHNKSKTVKI